MGDSYYDLSTGDRNYKSTVSVFSGFVWVFLKEEELPQIPVKVIRKSIYLPFLLLLMGQEVGVGS